ncbi:hypothetical protein [Nonomuraea sp. B1E8]
MEREGDSALFAWADGIIRMGTRSYARLRRPGRRANVMCPATTP